MSPSEDRSASADTGAALLSAPTKTSESRAVFTGRPTHVDQLVDRLAQRPDIQALRLSTTALNNLVAGLPPTWNITWTQARAAAAERAAALEPACQAARTMQAHRAHEAELAERKRYDMGQLAQDAEQVANERRAQAERTRRAGLEALNAAAVAADEALARAVAAHNALEEAQQIEDTRLAQEQERIDFFLREAQDKVTKAQSAERVAQETLAVANREMAALDSDLIEQNQILQKTDREEQDALADMVISLRTEHLRRIEEARAAARTRLAEQEQRAAMEAQRLEALRKEGEQLEREIQMAMEQDELMCSGGVDTALEAAQGGGPIIASAEATPDIGLMTTPITPEFIPHLQASASAAEGTETTAKIELLALHADEAVAFEHVFGQAVQALNEHDIAAAKTGTETIHLAAPTDVLIHPIEALAVAPVADEVADEATNTAGTEQNAQAATGDAGSVGATPALVGQESVDSTTHASAPGQAIDRDPVALTDCTDGAGAESLPDDRPQAHADAIDAANAHAEANTAPVALRYKGRVRGGMEITHDGDVVVEGQVHPGGLVTAGGDIHVYGTAAGRLAAGAHGDIHACIYVQSLEAEMVSIAGRYFMFEEILERWKDRPIRISLNAENRLSLEPIASMPAAGGARLLAA